MYLRESKQKRADGSVVTYLQLAENVWNAEKRRSETRILCNCGRADDEAVSERLRRLAKSILRRCSPEEIVAGDGNWRLVCAWPYGELHALEALWQRLGIGEVINQQAGARRLGFDVERALFAMVANRALAACSKLYCYEQWLREDIRIAGTEALSLQHLYRAMDFLEANQEGIERAIFFRVADLLCLNVDVTFYDTTSLHFEVDEEDHGFGAQDLVHGSRAPALPCAAQARAPEERAVTCRRSSSAWRLRARASPCATGCSRATRSTSLTIQQVKAELRGWQLTRGLFVGDAGMVSEANLKVLSRGGGKYLLCMPMRRGDEITQAVLSRPGRYQSVAENLQVKEVIVGEGERRRRYVLCHNPRGGRTSAIPPRRSDPGAGSRTGEPA